jgi:hypothetical protein
VSEPKPIVITVYPVGYSSHGQLYDAKAGDWLLARRSNQPLLTACRFLLSQGIPEHTVVEMRYSDRDDAYLRSTVGAAAGLTISDDRTGKPVFRKWKPSPYSGQESRAGTAPIHETEPAGTSTQRVA